MSHGCLYVSMTPAVLASKKLIKGCYSERSLSFLSETALSAVGGLGVVALRGRDLLS